MKTYRINFRRRFWNWLACGGHSILVLFIAYHLSKDYHGPGYQEITQAWGVFLVLDFPSGFISEALWALIDKISASGFWTIGDRTYYIVLPAIIFGSIGGIQYYLLGGWMAKFIEKRYQKNETKKEITLR